MTEPLKVHNYIMVKEIEAIFRNKGLVDAECFYGYWYSRKECHTSCAARPQIKLKTYIFKNPETSTTQDSIKEKGALAFGVIL